MSQALPRKRSGIAFRDLVLLLLATVLGLGGAVLIARKVARMPPHPGPAAPRRVTWISVTPESYQEPVLLDGMLEPHEQAALGFRVGGLLLRGGLREGDSVSPGDLLAELDPAPFQAVVRLQGALVRAAQARLDEVLQGPRSQVLRQLQEQLRAAQAEETLALSEWKRGQSLRERSALSQAELDQLRTRSDQARARVEATRASLEEAVEGSRAERIRLAQAELEATQARLAQAQLDLEATTLRAPFAGVVSGHPVALGTFLPPGQPLLKLVVVDPLEAVAGVPEKHLKLFAPGSPVSLLIDKTRTEARVHSLAPVVDRPTRTFLARIPLPNSERRFRVGQSLGIQAQLPPREILILPARAIVPSPGGKTAVYRVVPGKSPEEWISTRQEVRGHWLEDGRVEIREGLSPGDQVVISGASWLLEGDLVSQ